MLDSLRVFPDPRLADDHGLVAIGGSYRPRMLLEAYAHGIFPWPSPEIPFAWFSPNPRFTLIPDQLHVGKSLRKIISKQKFEVTFDQEFDAVIAACAAAPRQGQNGTWISPELIEGFVELHRQGYAHSVETWSGNRLVGGLYGVAIGRLFCGESMFHQEPNASKVAFVSLVERLHHWGYRLIDCQVETDLLASFGATAMVRSRFLDLVAEFRSNEPSTGAWRLR